VSDRVVASLISEEKFSGLCLGSTNRYELPWAGLETLDKYISLSSKNILIRRMKRGISDFGFLMEC
jgi:hypothetical protein